MSGGHFDYQQYRIENIAESIEDLVLNNDNDEKDEYGYRKYQHYPEDIIKCFKEAIDHLRVSANMAQRVDWLVSGDDGDDSFRKRWKTDVTDLISKLESDKV